MLVIPFATISVLLITMKFKPLMFFSKLFHSSRGQQALPLLLICVFSLAGCAEKGIPPKPEDGVLIYAALNPMTEDLEKSITRFNTSHEDVQIEVRDYSDENGEERLFTELSLGQIGRASCRERVLSHV